MEPHLLHLFPLMSMHFFYLCLLVSSITLQLLIISHSSMLSFPFSPLFLLNMNPIFLFLFLLLNEEFLDINQLISIYFSLNPKKNLNSQFFLINSVSCFFLIYLTFILLFSIYIFNMHYPYTLSSLFLIFVLSIILPNLFIFFLNIFYLIV